MLLLMNTFSLAVLFHILIESLVIVRVMVRRHREPASRIAWTLVIVGLPVFGILLYLFFGETSIGRRCIARMKEVQENLPAITDVSEADLPELYKPVFNLAKSISGFVPVGRNTGRLMEGSNETIDEMVKDIDAAQKHVHVLFYIWLNDNNGSKVIEALKRAALRGVSCRAMVDNLGSRSLIRSKAWKSMQDAGVKVAVALPIGNLLVRVFRGRVDLRNHRKIVVIDGRVTYCGSQNCADPEFRVKAKFAPWVDAVARFEGPIVRQNQHLFVSDWMAWTDEKIGELINEPPSTTESGFVAQVIATGPTVRHCAMPEMFEALIHASRKRLVISTPYYVPNESLQTAICTASYRGVDVCMILPERNDSWIVAGASRSYYEELLKAGVRVFEYQGGLLHTKSLTVDGKAALIGSANMDRRSFDLNYENNILVYDREFTQSLRERQQVYLDSSRQLDLDSVLEWSVWVRFWNNALAVLGPVL